MAKTTIEFNEKAATELERLTKFLEATSKAEVIRNALALYSFIIAELSAAGNLAIVKGTQIVKVIAVPGVGQPQQEVKVESQEVKESKESAA